MIHKGFVCQVSPIFSLGSYRMEIYCKKVNHSRSIPLNRRLPVNVLYKPFVFLVKAHLQNESSYIIRFRKLHCVLCKLLQMPLLFDLCLNKCCPFRLTSVVQGMCKYLSCNCSFLNHFLFIFLYQLNHPFLANNGGHSAKDCKILCFKCKKKKKKKKNASL